MLSHLLAFGAGIALGVILTVVGLLCWPECHELHGTYKEQH